MKLTLVSVPFSGLQRLQPMDAEVSIVIDLRFSPLLGASTTATEPAL